jgi:3-oxoacyl-[acyl-carrier-protein] synthase III
MPVQFPTLAAIEAFTPARSVAIEDVAGPLGLNRHQTRMFRRIHGLDRLHLDPELSLLDLVRVPAEVLLRSVADLATVRYLIYAHTVPDVTPSHINAAHMLGQQLALTRAEAFAVTQQNCASGLAAIDIAGELLRADGDPGLQALVVTGEKPFSRMIGVIPNTTIMGEASAAGLVKLSGPGIRVRSYVAKVMGQYAEHARPSPQVTNEFYETYTANLAATLREAAAQAGMKLADITMIVPHNVNLSSWRRIIAELGLDRNQVYLDNIPRYGHCFCSDPLLNLVSLRDHGRLVDGGSYLLTAVGLGATYAAMVVECQGLS